MRLLCTARILTAETIKVVPFCVQMNSYIIYWSKRDGAFARGRATEFNGILRITDLRPEDSGIYVCTGSNMYDIDKKTAELIVVQG